MPTNEAMKAAEAICKALGDASGASPTLTQRDHLAGYLDADLHLPALLAVAEAARIFVGFPAMGGEVMESARKALRGALDKLPKEAGSGRT